jgi:hypothetical protein
VWIDNKDYEYLLKAYGDKANLNPQSRSLGLPHSSKSSLAEEVARDFK